MSCNSCCARPDVDCRAPRATQLAAPTASLLGSLFVSLVVALALALPAHAASWHDDLPQAREIGSGEFRWFGFSLYSARLWSERRPFDTNAPFALELTYHRAISREQLVQTSIEQIKHLYGDSLPPYKLKRWEIEMTRAFRAVAANDQLIGVFLPLQGCRFYSQKEWIADIPDQEFATAFFAIWIDERTTATRLRAQLLGAAQ